MRIAYDLRLGIDDHEGRGADHPQLGATLGVGERDIASLRVDTSSLHRLGFPTTEASEKEDAQDGQGSPVLAIPFVQRHSLAKKLDIIAAQPAGPLHPGRLARLLRRMLGDKTLVLGMGKHRLEGAYLARCNPGPAGSKSTPSAIPLLGCLAQC